MMALDTSIYSQFLRPVKSVADYDQEFMAQQQNALALGNARQVNALNAMKFGEEQRQAQEAEVVRNALAQLPQGADYSARISALEGSRTPTGFAQADAIRKSMLEAEKERAGISKTTADTGKAEAETKAKQVETARKVLEYAIQGLQVVPDAQSAAQYIQQGVANGAWGMQQAQQMIATIPQDPAQFAQWRATQLRQTLAAKDQLPTVQTRNTGGSTDTLAIDPVTAQVTVANSVRNTQSPDSVASNATTMRGQNMADARARESLGYQREKDARDRELTGGAKPLTEGQAKALQFATRMEASNKILAQLERDGKVFSTPGARAGFGVGTAISAANTTKGQQLEQAKRDFINAVLRRESGAVIAESEFDNAEKQYFPQIGEGEAVIRQKAENRRIALEGIKADIPRAYQPEIDKIVSGGGNEPAVGTVESGYRYKGGGAADPKNWEKVK